MEEKTFIGTRQIATALFGNDFYHLDVGALLRLAKIPKVPQESKTNSVYVLKEKDILTIKNLLEELHKKICS